MKYLILIIILLNSVMTVNAITPVQTNGNNALRIVQELHNPNSKYVIVVAHRGDWRNYPENSLQGIESAIKMGVDVVELDVMMTRDSVLVLCHDKSINRTTTGRGVISEITMDSIQNCFLKSGHNCATLYKMPTLREALTVCKNRIVVNIDKGFQYYDEILKITEELGVTEQMLIKGKMATDKVEAIMSRYPKRMMYMPIVGACEVQGQKLFNEYQQKKIVPLAYEVCWTDCTENAAKWMKLIKSQGAKVWINTLWPSLCGNPGSELYDDYAFEHGGTNYKKVLDMGASIIQTDRPNLLIDYLRSIGRH